MADPPQTPEQIQAQAEATQNATTALNNNTQAQLNSNNITKESITAHNNYISTLEKNQAALTALATAAIGTRNILKGMTVDATGFTTFTNQFNELKDALSGGGIVAEVAKKKISDLGRNIESTGVREFAGASKMTASAILSLMENFVKGSDQAIVWQGAMLQNAAATGEFGKIMEKAGPDMEQINTIMMDQIDLMDKVGKITNKTSEQMGQYYSTLRTVPGALSEMVNMTGDGTSQLDMLTAAIRTADGTGQKFSDVVKSLHTSFSDYGVSGENALRFTARFSEIANKYGLELDDVRNGLMGATSAFKDMTNAGDAAANMQENISKIMDSYVQRLKDAGMTGRHAIEVFKGMTDNLSHMGIAQKAFLSAQTGGPGGLMGGFQIEKMIQQGDIEGLQKKFTQVMQKQFGKIVTLDEATKSQAGAAQLEKQVMMLRQGPMGSVVKSDQDAYKFLDAMKAQQEGRPTSKGAMGLDPVGLQNAMKTGSTWEQKTNTLVGNIASDLRELKAALVGKQLDMTQRALTAASMPTQGVRSSAEVRSQENLKKNLIEGETIGAVHSVRRNQDMQTPGVLNTDYSKENFRESANLLVEHVKQIPDALKGAAYSAGDAFNITKPGNKNTPPDLNADIEKRRVANGEALPASTAKMPTTATTAPRTTAPTTPATLAPPGRQVGAAARKVVSENFSSLDPKNFGEAPRAGAVVGAAQRGAPAAPKGASGAGEVPAAPTVSVDQPSSSGRFKVHVTVTEDKSDNGRAITPAGM